MDSGPSPVPGVPCDRIPSRYGPSAAATRASGGCCGSYRYACRSSHCMPLAICAGSSAVWLKTVYVAAILADAISTSSSARMPECFPSGVRIEMGGSSAGAA